MNGVPVLSILIALPALMAVAVLLIPASAERPIKLFSLAGSGVIFALATLVLVNFRPGAPGMQFEENIEWVPCSSPRC
jgi:NADH-quinone oxidoreductase subunit M